MAIYVVERVFGDYEDKTKTKLYVGINKATAFEIANNTNYPAQFEGDHSSCYMYISFWLGEKEISEYYREIWKDGFSDWERNSGVPIDGLSFPKNK